MKKLIVVLVILYSLTSAYLIIENVRLNYALKDAQLKATDMQEALISCVGQKHL